MKPMFLSQLCSNARYYFRRKWLNIIITKHLSEDRCFYYLKKEDTTNGVQTTQYTDTLTRSDQGYGDEYVPGGKRYMKFAMQMEQLTNQTRMATVLDADVDKKYYLSSAAKELDITVKNLKDSRIAISLPYLLPKNRSVNSDGYIIEPLANALRKYVEEQKPEKIRHALIVIRSVYTPDNEKIIRDNDNIEIHHVINIISTMLMVDDKRMDIVLCSRIGQKTQTIITVSERDSG